MFLMFFYVLQTFPVISIIHLFELMEIVYQETVNYTTLIKTA